MMAGKFIFTEHSYPALSVAAVLVGAVGQHMQDAHSSQLFKLNKVRNF